MGAYDNLEEWMAKSMGPSVGAPSSTYREDIRSELATFMANVENTAPATSADADAANNSIYYSSDQSALTYKDGDGIAYSINPIVSVKQYGAIGDGITDDTEAIQAAIDAVEAIAGTVILPAGEYSIAGSLTITSEASLVGQNATLTQVTEEAKTVNITGDNVSVSGIHFIGKGTEDPWDGTAWNGVAAIYVNGADNVNISGCKLTNHAGGGIYLSGACSDVTIRGNTIVGMGSTVIAAEDNGADGGITYGGTGSFDKDNLIISGNNISGHAFGIYGAQSENVLIEGNSIHDIPGQHGIYIANPKSVSIIGNVIRDIYWIGAKVQHQVAADTTAETVFSGNTIVGTGDAAISINPAGDGVGYYHYNVSVTGNACAANLYGVYARDCKRLYISSNRISDSTATGIYLRGCAGVVNSNFVMDTEQVGMWVLDGSGTVFISDMDFIGCPVNDAASGAYAYNNIIACTQSVGTTVVVLDKIRYAESGGGVYNSGATVTGIENMQFQPAPTQISDGDTAITAANIQSKLLYMASSTTGRAPTVPTGTAMYGICPVSNSIQWSFINTGDQVVTITQAANHTLVGVMALAAGESGTFLTRTSAINVAVTYRLA